MGMCDKFVQQGHLKKYNLLLYACFRLYLGDFLRYGLVMLSIFSWGTIGCMVHVV
jgi:hypothetical protein